MLPQAPANTIDRHLGIGVRGIVYTNTVKSCMFYEIGPIANKIQNNRRELNVLKLI